MARRPRTPEYTAWVGMRQRCKHRASYIKRGIKVCSVWEESFEAFFTYIGSRPSLSHSLDRIDNDRGYEPGNVRWATHEEQQRNRSNNALITWNGETLTVTEWAERMGLESRTLWSRIKVLKWPLDRAMTAEVRQSSRWHKKKEDEG